MPSASDLPPDQSGPIFPTGPRRPAVPGRPEEEALLAKLRQERKLDLGREVRMYEQVLRLAGDDSNPDWMACAAHNIRELMEKLILRLAGIEMPERRELRGQISNFVNTWTRHAPREGSVPTEPSCRKLLDHARRTIDWFTSSYPSRRKQVQEGLKLTGAAGAFPPTYTPDMFIGVWIELVDYFSRVAHHSEDCDAGDFRQAMRRFADHALALFARTPATLEDYDRIDQFIAEHE